MAVKLRLRREGTKKRPHYRVVVADSRSPRDGRFIEIIGNYHPMQEPSGISIDGERALYWLKNGAQPTEQVEQLLRITGVWEEFKPGDTPTRDRGIEKEKLSKKAREKAAEAKKQAEADAKKAEEEKAAAAEAAAAPAEEAEPAAEAPAEPEAAEAAAETTEESSE